jgi:hypothetical protein
VTARGPWAAAFLDAVGGEDTGAAVDALEVAERTIAATAGGCEVTLAAEPVPQRLWVAMWRFARGNGPLEAAAGGREQSEHLEHLLREDWDVALVPETIDRRCSCDGPGACGHVAAVARAVADAVDADPSVFLRWRGCTPERARSGPALDEEDEPALAPPEDWVAGELPGPHPRRPLPAGTVLRRLGAAGVRVGDRDLADALLAAYEAFGSMPNDAENDSPGSSTSSPSPD